MAFRPPQEQEQGVPSLGYRLSSNRQPGIEQSNNMMPQQGMDRPRFNPGDMMPMPQYERPIGRPGMGNYQQMGRQSTDPRERYIANTQGGHPNMSKYGYPMQDRNPTTMNPLMAMFDNPQVMRDAQYARKLENQMDPDNFFGNRMDVADQFGVDPFGDIDNYPKMSVEFGDEQAAVDPSDWRTLETIMGAGGNPEDYVQTAKAGDWTPSYKDPNFDQQLENLRKMENYWNMPPDWEYPPDDLIIDPFNENQLFGHTSKFAARGGLMSLRR